MLFKTLFLNIELSIFDQTFGVKTANLFYPKTLMGKFKQRYKEQTR